MDKGYLDKASCSACHKPGLTCCGTLMWKRDCFHDKVGYYWCASHANRGKLLNWALAHEYPSIMFTLANGLPRRIGDPYSKTRDNAIFWELAVVSALDEVIDAAMEYMANAQFMEEV